MSRLFNREIMIAGTSRTDAGVHAYGQRAAFTTDINIPIEKVAMVINNALCAAEGSVSGRGGFAKSPIRILRAEEKPEEFHARFDCKSKKYIYKIRTDADDESLVFERNYVYHVKEKLDAEAMNAAAGMLTGTHDFKSFEASGGNPRETTVRTIFNADVKSDTDGIELSIEGDGFLYNMVRIIAGTLVETGQGKRSPENMKKVIEAADRRVAGHTAPPGGLYLAEVYY